MALIKDFNEISIFFTNKPLNHAFCRKIEENPKQKKKQNKQKQNKTKQKTEIKSQTKVSNSGIAEKISLKFTSKLYFLSDCHLKRFEKHILQVV